MPRTVLALASRRCQRGGVKIVNPQRLSVGEIGVKSVGVSFNFIHHDVIRYAQTMGKVTLGWLSGTQLYETRQRATHWYYSSSAKLPSLPLTISLHTARSKPEQICSAQDNFSIRHKSQKALLQTPFPYACSYFQYSKIINQFLVSKKSIKTPFKLHALSKVACLRVQTHHQKVFR